MIARGETQEFEAIGPPRRSWPERVDRIVLLAGMNRGWTLSPKPKNMVSGTYAICRALYPLTKLPFCCRLIHELERGAPFVANLRVQWLNLLARNLIPTTVQILGDHDDIINRDDNVDCQVASGFHFFEVPANHATLVQFDGPDEGGQREETFKAAISASEEELRRRRDRLEVPAPNEKTCQLVGLEKDPVQDVLFVMHGIRDAGMWRGDFRRITDRIAQECGRRVSVITPAYERFPMARFLLHMERQKKVRWFMDQYTEVLARYPNARINFIGHSNGTYLLVSALRHYDACRFHRVAFAGSVAPRAFPWKKMQDAGRVAEVRNDIAAADVIVGVFPRFFEWIGEMRGAETDVGSAGFLGFLDDGGQQYEYTFFRGGHGAAIEPGNHESLIRFALDQGPWVPNPELLVPETAGWAKFFCEWCVLVWIVLVIGDFGLGYVLYLMSGGWPGGPVTYVLLYVALILIILFSV